MQVQNQRPIQRRHRDPVPPKFELPPRGEKCENWLKPGKRELRLRARSLNEQRINVIEIIVNRVVLIIFELFSVDIDNDASFKLDTDQIINELIAEFDCRLLSTWPGPKFRGNGWKTKKWEGKNGYYKLCKNWSDQNKCKIAHKFWLPIFDALLSFINILSYNKYEKDATLQNAFRSCLIYTCFYSICCSKVGFPKTRDLPLFLDTAIAKNTQIRKYLKAFDSKLHVYKFKEEESEKYNRDKKICQAVKDRCAEYLANTVQIKVNEFYKLIHYGDFGALDLDLEQFTFSIKYNTLGEIGRGQTQTPPSKNKISEHALIDEDDTKVSLSSAYSNLLCMDDNYLREEYDGLSYGASRGQSQSVRQSRYSPLVHNFDHELESIGFMHSNYHQDEFQALVPAPELPNCYCDITPPIQSQPQPTRCHNDNYLYDTQLTSDISNISNVSNTSFLSDSSSYDSRYRNDEMMMNPIVYNTYQPYTVQPYPDNYNTLYPQYHFS